MRHLYWGIRFRIPVSNRSATCDLAMFWHLLSTPHYCGEGLWSQTVLQEHKRGGSHLVRDQGCKKHGQTTPNLNALAMLECEQMYADVHCHGGSLHYVSSPQLLFWMVLHGFFSVLQYTSGIIVAHCWMNSNISTSFLSFPRKQLLSASGRCLFKLFSLFDECLCIHCSDYSLVTLFRNETQVSSPVTHTM
jgi:hypothetical protein